MANLNPLELERLKLLLSGKALTMGEKISTLDLLRSRFPDLFSGLTEKNLKDNNFLIKFLSDPFNRNKIKNALLNKLPPAQQIELAKSLEKPVATEGIIHQQGQGPTEQTAPVGATGGSSAGVIPSMPSVSIPAIHPVYRAKPPAPPQVQKPEIVIANKSGAVTEPGRPSELVTANKSGVVTGAPPSKIAITDSRGNIVKEHTIPSQRRFNFSSFKSSASSGFKKVQNFASPAGPFLKINSGRIGNGLKNMFGGAANFGGRAGLGAINHGGNFLSNLSNTRSRFSAGARSLSPKNMGSKRALLLFGGIFFLIFFMGALGGMSGTTPTGEAAPLTPGAGSDLDNKYNFSVFNIFDGNAVNDSLLKKYIDRALATGKVKSDEQKNLLPSRAKFIRDQAQIAGLNPAIFLGYWESETAFSDYTYPGARPGSDLGCDPTNPALKTFEDSVLCAVGKSQISNSRTSQCAISKDINSPACQAIAFQQAEGVKLPISTLKDFLNSYGSKVADPNNIKSDNIVKQTIVDLGLVPYTATSPSQKEFMLSCPIANENNTCSHFDDPRDPCHCNPSQYLSMAACQADASLNYGIDVGTKASKTALIPYITYQGETTPQSITCQLITAQSPTQPNPQSGGELQQILHYHCSTGKTDLYLQYNHIKASSSFPTTVSSGQLVGDIANYGEGFRRLNIQVGVNGECAYNQTQSCKRGGDYFQCPLQKESPPDY